MSSLKRRRFTTLRSFLLAVLNHGCGERGPLHTVSFLMVFRNPLDAAFRDQKMAKDASILLDAKLDVSVCNVELSSFQTDVVCHALCPPPRILPLKLASTPFCTLPPPYDALFLELRSLPIHRPDCRTV